MLSLSSRCRAAASSWGSDFVERTEAAQCLRLRDVAGDAAGDERVDAHREVKADLVVRLGFDASASADGNAEGAPRARREHGRSGQADCGVFRMPVTVSA
jgi:hypothetical protein